MSGEPRIRLAVASDVPGLEPLGQAFWREVYALTGAGLPDENYIQRLLTRMIATPAASAIFVAEIAGTIVGTVGVVVFPDPFNGVLIAGEQFWYVDPPHRGTGASKRLIAAAEAWATTQGATAMILTAPPGLREVGVLYQRWGYTAYESTFRRPLAPPATRVTGPTSAPAPIVIDQALPDPEAYRARALEAHYFDWHAHGGAKVFRGLAAADPGALHDLIAARWPTLRPTLSFFRKSPAHQAEPHYIHTDVDMGDWTAILYLNPAPPPLDGTLFWRHTASGAVLTGALAALDQVAEQPVWDDTRAWDVVATVPAAFNRLVLFDARRFHSRALKANYGTGDHARLTQIVFGTGDLYEGRTWQ